MNPVLVAHSCDHFLFALPPIEKIGSILLMILFLSVLVMAHEWGHFFVARKCGIRVERFGLGLPFGPTLWQKKIGDVEYCIHACLFGGYVSFPDDNPDNPLPKDSPERFENNPVWARFAVMIAGVAVNAILGWLILFSVFTTWGCPTGEAEKQVLVGGVTTQESPAARAGFQKDDEIKAIGQHPILGKDYIEMATMVQNTMRQYKNTPVQIAVLRHGHPIVLTARPDANGRIGIRLSAIQRYEHLNPLVTAKKTSQFLGNVIEKNFEAFGKMFTGKLPLSMLSGPLRIVKEGATLIDENGIQTGLTLTAFISTMLAVMNLLPIPALDGGHILFLVIEMIKGSPVSLKIRERVTQYGFMGLLGLIVLILLNDINNTLIHPTQLP